MKHIYEFMKSKHPFLTSSDDYSNAALIAINSKDLEHDLDYIEKCYELLNNNEFSKGNALQSLSHIMSFSKDDADTSCKRVAKLRDTLESKGIKLYGAGYPLIGAISLLNIDEEVIANEILEVSDYLKDIKGFGNFVLGKQHRYIISCNIVASSYEESLTQENTINEVTNSILLDIIVALEIATMMSIIAATTVSATNS